MTPILRSFPLILLASLLLAAPAAAVDPALLDLAPPDANFVIGIRVTDIVRSPLVSGMIDDAKAGSPEIGMLFGGPDGGGAIEGLEEILIVGRAEPEGDADAEDDSLALLRGDFTSPLWTDFICSEGCETSEYQGFEIRSGHATDKPADFVALDARYAAVGAPARVREAIDRRQRGERSAFAAAVSQWSEGLGRRPLWLAATGPFDVPQESMGGMAIPGMDQIEGLGLGLDLGQDLDVVLELRTRDETAARELYDSLQGLLALFALTAQSEAGEDGEGANPQAEIAGLLESLNLRQEARVLHASLRIPASEVEKRFAEGLVTFDEAAGDGAEDGGSISVFGSEQGTTVEPSSQGSREGVIRIYGLEQEAVEVPSGPQ